MFGFSIVKPPFSFTNVKTIRANCWDCNPNNLAFDFVVLQFVLTSAIQHSSFQFLYSNCRFDIVSRFNIVV